MPIRHTRGTSPGNGTPSAARKSPWRAASRPPRGRKAGRLDLHTFVNVASTQVAKTFGLFPRKGAIQPGADADLVIYDPAYRGTISAKTQSMNVDYSAFEGWPIDGRPSAVAVRGEVAVRDGKFVGMIGRGQFLKREPSH